MMILLVILVSIPKILSQKLFLKKKFPTFKERLGFSPPTTAGRVRIWVHAVSVGEVKAARPLMEVFLARGSSLLITTATLAGKEEAKRIYPYAQVRIMPLDIASVMRRWLRSFCPQQLFFIEGDLWPNLLREAKKCAVKTALISGKISERSLRRFLWVPFFARTFFDRVDLFCVQNEEQRARFAQLTDRKIYITGNLKLGAAPQRVDPEKMRDRFALHHRPVITIASTHAPEEKELLQALASIPELIIFLAPRHPERFNEVANLLERPFCRWKEKRHDQSLILVDAMGELPHCFAVSNLTIVAGSFSSRVGGHNVWEPCSYGCPVLFGPHMHAQKELAALVLDAGAGRQVTVDQLAAVVRSELQNPTLSCQKLAAQQNCTQLITLLEERGLCPPTPPAKG